MAVNANLQQIKVTKIILKFFFYTIISYANPKRSMYWPTIFIYKYSIICSIVYSLETQT